MWWWIQPFARVACRSSHQSRHDSLRVTKILHAAFAQHEQKRAAAMMETVSIDEALLAPVSAHRVVQLRAPTDLAEGYELKAVVDGRSICVQVVRC